MSRNKNKLVRKITIDNKQYNWCVVSFNCDGDGGSRFQIWENRIKIFEQIIHEIITPKRVREEILKLKNCKNDRQ